MFGLIKLLILFALTSGTALSTGKILLLDLENGIPFTSVCATIPVTTRADGSDPPSTSCIKNSKTGTGPPVAGPGRGIGNGGCVVVVGVVDADGGLLSSSPGTVGICVPGTSCG